MSMTFKILPGQNQAGVFYTNRTEALIEVSSPDGVTLQIVEGSNLKKGGIFPTLAMDTRIANHRIPAGHWLVVSRENPVPELEIRVRRLQDASSVLNSPSVIVSDEALSVSDKNVTGLVRNDLSRPMPYRLIVRADLFDENASFYVQSGADAIYPLSGSFILDTVVPAGGILEIRSVEGKFTGHYDLLAES